MTQNHELYHPNLISPDRSLYIFFVVTHRRTCDTVTLWHCDTVTLWHCGTVIHWHCDTVTLWHCDTLTLWHCAVPILTTLKYFCISVFLLFEIVINVLVSSFRFLLWGYFHYRCVNSFSAGINVRPQNPTSKVDPPPAERVNNSV